MDFWQYTGEPQHEEILKRIDWGNCHLGFKHQCIHCGRDNTEFIRNIYWICHNCAKSFTTYQAMDRLRKVLNLPMSERAAYARSVRASTVHTNTSHRSSMYRKPQQQGHIPIDNQVLKSNLDNISKMLQDA